MNSLIQEEFPLHETQRLRYDLLDALTDHDLSYKLPGDNPTLGELCREIGELEHSYIQSFRTFRQDWSFRNSDPEMVTRVDALRTWFRALDDEFEAVMRGFTDEDLHTVEIDRNRGFVPTVYVQFEIYREAIMMFYAKASVYLKALQKPMNDNWQIAIG